MCESNPYLMFVFTELQWFCMMIDFMVLCMLFVLISWLKKELKKKYSAKIGREKKLTGHK